jgi:hypothetical protein
MRDGGWKKNKTARDGWRVRNAVTRDKALSEYQKTHNDKLSVPKRQSSKYEQKLL